MREFSYVRPKTLDEALELMQLHAGRIRPYAGGTDIMVHLRSGSSRFDNLDYMMDLGDLQELKSVTCENGTVTVGAMVSHECVSHHPIVLEHAPMLAQACHTVGATQIRNAGTIGGNVCNASIAADSLSPLAAMDAVCNLQSKTASRSIPLAQFITGSEKTCIQPDEILVSLSFPSFKEWNTAFFKLGRRRALAISRITASTALHFVDGKITEARIAPGCVFVSPRRCTAAEDMLKDKEPSLALFNAIGEEVANEMVAVTGVRWSTEYKQPVLASVVSSALCMAAGISMEEE